MNVSFVILHYLAPDVTCRCVDLLLKDFGGDGARIVVVDNCSPDGSGGMLQERYASNSSVTILLLGENCGFARGNNAGYHYAVSNHNPDFVVVMNNDVMIEDDSFVRKMEEEYRREPFSVLGPDIWSPSARIHQNPSRLYPLTRRQAGMLRFKMSLKYRFFPFFNLIDRIRSSFPLKPAVNGRKAAWTVPRYGCVLHGACYVFSRDFIERRPLAFNPSTFLYAEEDILHFECSRDGLEMRYCPDLKVIHLEDVSTDASFSSSTRKRRVKYGRLADSFGILISLMAKP